MAKKKKTGRPTMKAKDRSSARLMLRLTISERRQIETRAKQAGQTPSGYVRTLVFSES